MAVSTFPQTTDNPTARDHQIRSLLNMVSDHRSRFGEFRFRQMAGAQSGVAIDDLLVLLWGVLTFISKRTPVKQRVGSFLASRLQPNGLRQLGSRGPWTGENLGRWLRFERETGCPETSAKRIVVGLAQHIQQKVATDWDGLERIVEDCFAASEQTTVEAIAHAMVDCLPAQSVPEWSPTFGFTPLLDASLTIAPRSFDPKRLNEVVDQVHEHLTEPEGPRVAIVRGAPYSGKKDVLRRLLQRLPRHCLNLDNDVRIPTLALALDDHNPRSFIETVYRFFAAARYRAEEVQRRIDELDETAMLSRITALAKEVPACVLLADIAAIEQDEILRPLAGSYASDIIAALLAGHRFTRIAFTTSASSEHGDAALEATLKCRYPKIYHVSGSIPLSHVLEQLALPVQEGTAQIDGLTAQIAQTALNFRSRLSEKDKVRLEQSCRDLLRDDDPEGLIRLLCGKVLTQVEYLASALIAASHDGLRFATFSRLLNALGRISPNPWNSVLSADLRAVLRGLTCKELINHRTMIERAPDDTLGVQRTTLFAVDDGWRRLLLRHFCETDPARARTLHWLIAREAAAQSRHLRETHWRNRHEASFTLDLQALHAALASVDVAAVDAAPAHAPAAGNDDYGPIQYGENVILPALDRNFEPPSGRATLRYAYLQLYTRDLDGKDFGLLSRKQDARTRLAILLRLFAPEAPWMRLEDQTLPTTLRCCHHILIAFDREEVMRILLDTAISASRLQRYDVVTAAARLGEQLFVSRAGAGIAKATYMRLLRTEVEAGLLLGGNPDDVRSWRKTAADDGRDAAGTTDLRLRDVEERLSFLLSGPFAVSGSITADDMLARGKLHTRLAETLQMCGRFHHARRHFMAAIALERQLAKVSDAASLAPVLGGHGVRSYLRYLLHRIRLTSGKGRFPTFIFIDELPLPAPPLVADTRDLREALDIHAVNVRRSGGGRVDDAVGVKIDTAQLAVLRHDFVGAYQAADSVLSDRMLSGSSLGLLLELMAVRSRHLLDGAVLCLQQNAKAPIFNSSRQVADIARYFDLPREALPLDTAYHLLQSANDSLSSFRKLLDSNAGPLKPYSIYQRYLQILSTALGTRFCLECEVESTLGAALADIEDVINDMMRFDYEAHLFEASRFRNGLRLAAVHYGRKRMDSLPG